MSSTITKVYNEVPPENVRPKVVTVKHPESNKPKPTSKKGKPLQLDQTVLKALHNCKNEGNPTNEQKKKEKRRRGSL